MDVTVNLLSWGIIHTARTAKYVGKKGVYVGERGSYLYHVRTNFWYVRAQGCQGPQYLHSENGHIGCPSADWIQGYMYTLGRRGLRVSNSPVSS